MSNALRSLLGRRLASTAPRSLVAATFDWNFDLVVQYIFRPHTHRCAQNRCASRCPLSDIASNVVCCTVHDRRDYSSIGMHMFEFSTRIRFGMTQQIPFDAWTLSFANQLIMCISLDALPCHFYLHFSNFLHGHFLCCCSILTTFPLIAVFLFAGVSWQETLKTLGQLAKCSKRFSGRQFWRINCQR